MHNITEMVDFSLGVSPVSTSAAPTVNEWKDVRGHEYVTYVILVGVIAATGTVDFKLQQAKTNAGGSKKNIAGATIEQIDADGDNKIHAITVKASKLDADNGFFYIAPVVTNAAADGAVSVLGIFYRSRENPPDPKALTQDVKVL